MLIRPSVGKIHIIQNVCVASALVQNFGLNDYSIITSHKEHTDKHGDSTGKHHRISILPITCYICMNKITHIPHVFQLFCYSGYSQPLHLPVIYFVFKTSTFNILCCNVYSDLPEVEYMF